MRVLWVAGVCFGLCIATGAQPAASKSDAEIKVEYEQAQKVYIASNFVAALPMFEDLHTQRPKDLIYQERLAMCLLGTADSLAPAEQKEAHARAKRLLLDAQANGDKSPLLVTLLEKMGDGDGYELLPAGSVSPAKTDFKAAEKLFGSGDMKGALALYQKALAEDPTMYAAALYAGDALFKSGDCPGAGAYYAKAVALDPDHETAYRYWADCLVKQNDMSRAREMYIKALIAQPYQQTTRRSLADWAMANHLAYGGPDIRLPAGPTPGGKPGDMTINLDPSGGPDAMMQGILYSGTRASWQKEEFRKHFPAEKTYRHSLPEEAAAIRSMLSASAIQQDKKKKDDRKDPSIQLLEALEKDGMLECWILLDRPDQGIAQDYMAYRKDHRELMAQYIAKYDIHPMLASTSRP